MTLLRGDWFYAVLVALDAFFMSRPYLYVIQQDNYRVGEIFKSRRLGFVYLFDFCAVAVFLGIWLACYFMQTRAFWGFLVTLFFFIAEFAMYFMEDLPARKKPLKYTKRAVRCLVFNTIFSAAAVICCFGAATQELGQSYLRYLVLYCFPLSFPALFAVGTTVINMFEKLNNRRYMRRATKTLAASQDLIKIAITGSFGKTSVKNYLHAMLAEKYNVLSTPQSYNTPMGICKTLDALDPTYDVFIAEFGARRVGDIRTLMRMVKPDFAVLTGINDQHLETFKTQQNIIREKCRVLDISEQGVCAVNVKLKQKAEDHFAKAKRAPRLVFAGLDENADVCATDIDMSEAGTAFTLKLGNESISVCTQLIGMQNIENITLAAAMAYSIGLETAYIADAIARLEAVPHRMQLIRSESITIIDDSFNSNPDGAVCALDTLAMFDRRKVVLTPGLVELGEKENEENYKLGKKIAEVGDLVLLVGTRRTDQIRRGLIDGGYGGEIHIYDSLNSAEKDFDNRLRAGDALLILNDLPDIYEERRK